MIEVVRERQDGARRKSWNEIECGSYYARSTGSCALVLAATVPTGGPLTVR